jgi:hypothetical protein
MGKRVERTEEAEAVEADARLRSALNFWHVYQHQQFGNVNVPPGWKLCGGFRAGNEEGALDAYASSEGFSSFEDLLAARNVPATHYRVERQDVPSQSP